MLYYIKDLDVNEVFRKLHEVNFKQIISGPEQNDAMSVFYYNEDVKRNNTKGNPIEKYEDLLIGRIRFIIHVLAKRCSSNKYGWTRLSTYMLKTTIGNDYKKIFNTLDDMGVSELTTSILQGNPLRHTN